MNTLNQKGFLKYMISLKVTTMCVYLLHQGIQIYIMGLTICKMLNPALIFLSHILSLNTFFSFSLFISFIVPFHAICIVFVFSTLFTKINLVFAFSKDFH